MAAAGQVLANVNVSRYLSAVLVVGKEEVWRAFDWLYRHHTRHQQPRLYVGEYLRGVQENNTKIKKTINAADSKALHRQEDPAKMDISLLYKLLQHTCGLAADTPEFAWNKPPEDAAQQSLEHWLYRVKEIRNEVSHEYAALINMSDAELGTRLDELSSLLCKIVQSAGRRSARPDGEVKAAVATVKEKLTLVQTSMPPSAIRPEEFALEAKKELGDQWQGCTTWGDHLSPPLLRWAVEDQEVGLSQLLQGLGEKPPQVVVVLGEPGIGKSSLCWQLLDGWLQGDAHLADAAAQDLVVLVQCRHIFTRDLTRLLTEELLPRTCRRCRPEEVLELLGSLRVLWLVDGFEEATADAKSVVGRLVGLCDRDHTVLLTGHHDYLEEMAATLAAVPSLVVCHATHFGLTESGFRARLAGLVEAGEGCGEPPWGERCAAFAREVAALSPLLLQELYSPLKLMLAVRLWEEGRLGEAAGAPLASLYAAIQDALVTKLVAKLRAKNSLTEGEARDRVRRWVGGLCREGLDMWARGCFVTLDAEAEQRLEDRAVELMLPYTDCFSTFLGSSVGPGRATHCFLHHTHQSVMAAQHLHTLVLQGGEVQQVKATLLPGPDNTSLDRFLDMLIHVATGLAAEGSLDEKRAGVLAGLLEQCRFCQWLEVVRRTKCCPAMVRQAHRRLAGMWEVNDNTLEAAAALVAIGPPLAIFISLGRDPRDNPVLQELLRCLSQSSAEVTVKALHCFLYGFDPVVPLYSTDHLLHDLCGPTSACHLVYFHGFLTGEGCRLLHRHCSTLHCAFVGVMDHEALARVILLSHQAPHLEMLQIHVLCSLDAAPKKSVPRRVNDCRVSLMQVEEGEAKKAVELICRIGHSFSAITLNYVMPSTTCNMLRAFKEMKVRTHSLGRWTKFRFMDLIVLQHLHYFPLPPPPEFTPRLIYKMWNNPNIECQLTVTLTPGPGQDATHPAQDQSPARDTGCS
ncbi:hypothetical protein GWK47_004847 [Chionoecetes opilio]|uniref:NACHT domain-containing protein n=1 Tax=Chionoecetes opilio TaxID=41210 RepID=A0A8J5CXR6_CHIOP|nr:hypothetical protein GWK47_004847 [Chionoecetes opilio]